jgi:hypothetical protein
MIIMVTDSRQNRAHTGVLFQSLSLNRRRSGTNGSPDRMIPRANAITHSTLALLLLLLRKTAGITITTDATTASSTGTIITRYDAIDSSLLRDAVTVDGITAHLEAFQAVATANNNTRFAGSKGHQESMAYVQSVLEQAGYIVTVEPFAILRCMDNDATGDSGIPSTCDTNLISYNVFADTPSGRTDRVIVVGAHLDSVRAGPGINDNGSGAATILEIAVQLQKQKAQLLNNSNAVRFAWFSGEELQLSGSRAYVEQRQTINDDGFKTIPTIAAMINFDMLASPNYVRFVYDGDGSDNTNKGPEGSGVIEKMFQDYFVDQDLPVEPIFIGDVSDYYSFSEVGIPVGGIFSGHNWIKTKEEAAIYGGQEGEPYDACYHQACDTIENINRDVLDELSDAAAHAVLTLAMHQYPGGGESESPSASTNLIVNDPPSATLSSFVLGPTIQTPQPTRMSSAPTKEPGQQQAVPATSQRPTVKQLVSTHGEETRPTAIATTSSTTSSSGLHQRATTTMMILSTTSACILASVLVA